MREAEGVCPYIDTCPDYIVRDEMVHIYIGSQCLCVMPIRVFMQGHARSGAAVAAYYARKAEVVPLRLRGG